MNRRTYLGAVAGGLLTSLLATPPSADAQPTENMLLVVKPIDLVGRGA